jgi:tRNA(Ile2) C34 agmatinyltransferase TiaS
MSLQEEKQGGTFSPRGKIVTKNTKSPVYHGQPLCAHCGSAETQVGFDEITCRRCGRQTSLKTGEAISVDKQYAPYNL